MGERRLDETLGLDAALIGRDLPPATPPGLRRLELDDPELGPFADSVADWLETQGAAAVLVRPDRHVFGTGDAKALLRAWADHVRPKALA
jgi:3-(3-hydroxy-phenyl)propionate hydroxylase